jgi:hypothetical protein
MLIRTQVEPLPVLEICGYDLDPRAVYTELGARRLPLRPPEEPRPLNAERIWATPSAGHGLTIHLRAHSLPEVSEVPLGWVPQGILNMGEAFGGIDLVISVGENLLPDRRPFTIFRLEEAIRAKRAWGGYLAIMF